MRPSPCRARRRSVRDTTCFSKLGDAGDYDWVCECAIKKNEGVAAMSVEGGFELWIVGEF